MNAPVRVVLVDDHRLCQKGLAELLENAGDFKVIGTAGNPAQAEALIRENAPDLAVLDLRMPLMDGVSLLRQLRAEGCEVPAVKRSEERRVGKECPSKCRSRWSADH